jgi:hypothetical protein
MTARLDQRVAERLAKVCGLFSSAHAGERASAAAKADRLLRDIGLTWTDVICAPTLAPPPRPQWRGADWRDDAWRTDWHTDWRTDLQFAAARMHDLNQRERDFINNLVSAARWRAPPLAPTARQCAWLSDICRRLRETA